MSRICHSAFLKKLTSFKYIFHNKILTHEVNQLLPLTFNRSIFISCKLESSTWGSKKPHRKVKLHVPIEIMADPKTEEILAPLRASVKEQVCNIHLN